MNHGEPAAHARTDREELKEVIKEFLNHYQYLHEKRVHKLLFYSEIYTLQHHGERISNADFKPYDYGPYATLIRDVLYEMADANDISMRKENGATIFEREDGGELSQSKQSLIEEIHDETRSMKTSELVAFAKTTPLWNDHEYNEVMDFEAYLADCVLDEDTRADLANAERNPASQNRVESLLS